MGNKMDSTKTPKVGANWFWGKTTRNETFFSQIMINETNCTQTNLQCSCISMENPALGKGDLWEDI